MNSILVKFSLTYTISKEQTISCSLTVCPVESCYRPASDEACPSEGHDFLYHYYAPKN